MKESTGAEVATPVGAFTSMWARSGKHFWKGLAAANRAFLSSNGERDDVLPTDDPSVAFTSTGWQADATVKDRTAITVGDSVTFSKQFTDEEVGLFAQISGDSNRLHLDEKFASDTRFESRIVHGTLASGLISAALARLPGVTIYLSQDLEFLRPVDIGERLTGTVEIVEDLGESRYRLSTTVENDDGEIVIDGEAVVMVDQLPETAD